MSVRHGASHRLMELREYYPNRKKFHRILVWNPRSGTLVNFEQTRFSVFPYEWSLLSATSENWNAYLCRM
jgi:hypothetical protein